MSEREDRIGVPLKRAAEIIGVSRARIISWGKAGLLHPEARVDIGSEHRWLYSLDELAAGRMIVYIEEAGVDAHQLSWMVSKYRNPEVTNPLLGYRWAVDRSARKAYVSLDSEHWMDGVRTYQHVMPEVIDIEALRTSVRQAVTRRRGAPGSIVRNRGKLGSKPVFAPAPPALTRAT